MDKKSFVSLVVAAYNEEGIIERNLEILCNYMQSLEDRYTWEIIVVNDGSKDGTGEIAEKFAENYENIVVIHHRDNKNLGSAIRTGFEHCRGDYVITLDLDLSYSPEHILVMLNRIKETNAEIVLASPYMKGGKLTGVPFLRKFFSKSLNFLLYIIQHMKHFLIKAF